MPTECNGLKSICDSFAAKQTQQARVIMSFLNTTTITITNLDLDRELANLANREGTASSQRVIVNQTQQDYEVSGDIFDLFEVTPFEYPFKFGLLGGSDVDSSDISFSDSGQSDIDFEAMEVDEPEEEDIDMTSNIVEEFEVANDGVQASAVAGCDAAIIHEVEDMICTCPCPTLEDLVEYGTYICCKFAIDTEVQFENKEAIIESFKDGSRTTQSAVELLLVNINNSINFHKDHKALAECGLKQLSAAVKAGKEYNPEQIERFKENIEEHKQGYVEWKTLKDVFTKNSDRLARDGIFDRIKENFDKIAIDKNLLNVFELKVQEMTPPRLRAALVVCEQVKDLENKINELGLKDSVNVDNLRCYITENSKLLAGMTVEQIIDTAFKEQLEIFINKDNFLKYFNIKHENNKITVQMKEALEVLKIHEQSGERRETRLSKIARFEQESLGSKRSSTDKANTSKTNETSQPGTSSKANETEEAKGEKRGIKDVFLDKDENKAFIVQKDKIAVTLMLAKEAATKIIDMWDARRIKTNVSEIDKQRLQVLKSVKPVTKHDFRNLKEKDILFRHSDIKGRKNTNVLTTEVKSKELPTRTKMLLETRAKESKEKERAKDDASMLRSVNRKADLDKISKILGSIAIEKGDKEYSTTKSKQLSDMRRDRLKDSLSKLSDAAKPSASKNINKFYGSTMQSAQNVRGGKAGKASSKFVSKCGDHSVTLNGVIDVEMNPTAATTGSNMLAWAHVRVYDARSRVGFDRLSGGWKIVSKVMTPVMAGVFKDFDHTHAWERFFHRQDMPATTHIDILGNIEKDQIDISHSVDIIRSDLNALAKPAADALMSSLYVSKQVAEVLATRVGNNLTRYDNSYLFFKLALLAMMLHDCELNGIAYRFGDVNRDGVRIINIQPDNAGMQALGSTFDEILAEGRFTLRSEEVGATDAMIMMLMASPLSVVQLQNGNLNHVFTTFKTENIKWAILHRGNRILEQNIQVTSDQVWQYMKSLANTLRMREDMRLGVIHAMRVGCGIVDYSSAEPVYFTCGLETRRITLPSPRAHNPLWRLMQREQEETIPPTSQSEISHLSNISIDEYQTSVTLIAAIFSSSVSTVLNRYCLTAREVNELISQESLSPQAVPLMDRLIRIQQTEDRAAIFCFALGIMVQICGLVINSDAFRQTEWSAGLRWPNHRAVGANELWQGRWGQTVPYIFDPIVIFPYCEGVPVEWNISGPEMSMNIGSECVVQGDAGTQAFYIETGERRYTTNAQAGEVYLYLGYSNHVLNFILQHDPYGMEELPFISFEMRTVLGNVVRTVSIRRDLPQPILAYGIRRIAPGTLLNWDWHEYRQIAPIIYRDDMGDRMFLVLASTEVVKSQYAGICAEDSRVNKPLVPGVNIDRAFEGMGTFTCGVGKVQKKKDRKFGKKEN